MGQLDAATPYGNHGQVQIECTDFNFGVRWLAQLEVLATGKGALVQ